MGRTERTRPVDTPSVLPELAIRGLSKRYGSFVALAPTDLDVAEGEFLTLLGPSGSGKTTLLSLIAGLAVPDDGRLLIRGQDVTFGAPYERDIGMVFQNYALFPHMTVLENIAFPLKMRRAKGADATRRARAALDLVHLPQVADRYPKELSGGQQQRIALARCLVYEPSIVLMDEPLGALDKKLRDRMQLEIKRIHREVGTTIVYVTHDQEEAMTMSDRICLMNAGRIEQLGTPADLYFRPRTLFVADFLGESNLLEGTVATIAGDAVGVALLDGATTIPASLDPSIDGALAVGRRVRVMVRPQNVVLADEGAALRGRVKDSMITGSLTKLYVSVEAVGHEPVVLSFPTSSRAGRHAIGAEVGLAWHPHDAVVLAETA